MCGFYRRSIAVHRASLPVRQECVRESIFLDNFLLPSALAEEVRAGARQCRKGDRNCQKDTVRSESKSYREHIGERQFPKPENEKIQDGRCPGVSGPVE